MLDRRTVCFCSTLILLPGIATGQFAEDNAGEETNIEEQIDWWVTPIDDSSYSVVVDASNLQRDFIVSAASCAINHVTADGQVVEPATVQVPVPIRAGERSSATVTLIETAAEIKGVRMTATVRAFIAALQDEEEFVIRKPPIAR